jgi:hypothetical protein
MRTFITSWTWLGPGCRITVSAVKLVLTSTTSGTDEASTPVGALHKAHQHNGENMKMSL